MRRSSINRVAYFSHGMDACLSLLSVSLLPQGKAIQRGLYTSRLPFAPQPETTTTDNVAKHPLVFTSGRFYLWLGFALYAGYVGALPQSPPKELRPFGIPASCASLLLVSLATLRRLCPCSSGFALMQGTLGRCPNPHQRNFVPLESPLLGRVMVV